MAKIIEKREALALRKQGTSIKQIAKQLAVSPSTVSVWCKDVKLTTGAMAKIVSSSTNRSAEGLLAYSQAKQEARLANTRKNYAVGAEMLTNVSKRDLLMLGIGLYWGEGYKTGNREFGFTNSDPEMMKLYIVWLYEIFNIGTDELTLRVSINELHSHRILKVESYWSDFLGIPKTQFTKPSLIKTSSKKQYPNTKEHFGTLRIKVQKGSDYREQILGAIEKLKTYSTPNSRNTRM